MSKHQYTWLPDLPDQRDHLFRTSVAAPELPPLVDLRAKCPPIVDQGQLGSCTANALAGMVEFAHGQFSSLSRLFIYYNERVIEDTIRQDAGAMIRDGVKSLHKQGVCRESEWPYDIAKFRSKPTKKCYTDAQQLIISDYSRLLTLNDMQLCLASGHPFVFGFTVYESFESKQVAASGILNMPALSEKAIGGHAVMAVGYDMDAQRLIVRNSWGTSWGQQGYFTMPFAYVESRTLSDDFWTIRK